MTKKCAYCAEDIQEAAVLCKHCGKAVKPPLLQRRIVFFEPLLAVVSLIAGFYFWPLWLLAIVFVLLTLRESKK